MVVYRDGQGAYNWTQFTSKEVTPNQPIGIILENGTDGKVVVYGQFTLNAAWLEDYTTYYYFQVSLGGELNVTKTKIGQPIFTHTTGGQCFMYPPTFTAENGSFYIRRSASNLNDKVLLNGNVLLNTSKASINPCDSIEYCCGSYSYGGYYFNRIITKGVCKPTTYYGSSPARFYVSETGAITPTPPTTGSKAVVGMSSYDASYLVWPGAAQYIGQIVETLPYSPGMTVPTIPGGTFLAIY
jgi:hypothetical protein